MTAVARRHALPLVTLAIDAESVGTARTSVAGAIASIERQRHRVVLVEVRHDRDPQRLARPACGPDERKVVDVDHVESAVLSERLVLIARNQ